MCTGCSELVSLHPFVPEKEAILDARLPGVWTSEDDLYVVRQEGSGYAIDYSERKSASIYKLKATMLKVGSATILDLTPAGDDAFRIAVHTPLRVWIEGATLRIAYLDSKWLREQADGRLGMQKVDGRPVITSPGEEVTRFLLAFGADDRAYGTPEVLTRQ